MILAMILGLVLLAAVLWWLLDRREERRVSTGQPRHSGLRLVFAAAALLLMLFSGGCSLLFGLNADGLYVTAPAVLVIGGPPFAVGLLVWWLAMRRGNPAA
jgi:hypothetical protein